MQSVSSRIWTRIAVFISYGDNDYTTTTAASGIGLHINSDKTEYMRFNKKGDTSILSGGSLKLVNVSNYLGSSVSSTENDINKRVAKTWSAIDRLWIIWKSNQSDKIKRYIFRAVVV